MSNDEPLRCTAVTDRGELSATPAFWSVTIPPEFRGANAVAFPRTGIVNYSAVGSGGMASLGGHVRPITAEYYVDEATEPIGGPLLPDATVVVQRAGPHRPPSDCKLGHSD